MRQVCNAGVSDSLTHRICTTYSSGSWALSRKEISSLLLITSQREDLFYWLWNCTLILDQLEFNALPRLGRSMDMSS